MSSKKYAKGVLGRWAAGASGGDKSPEQILEEAQRETFAMHRSSVLWYLGRKLEGVGEVQRGMMERRLERDLEKGRSVLYKVSGSVGAGQGLMGDALSGGVGEGLNGRTRDGNNTFGGGVAVGEDESRKEIEQQLSPEQLQLFARENQDMLKQYEDTLDQVRSVLPICFFLHLVLTHRHFAGPLNVPCSRYPSYKPPWSRILRCRRQIFLNWSPTRCLQRKMLAVGTKNSKGQRRGGALPEWFSGLVVGYVGSWLHGT